MLVCAAMLVFPVGASTLALNPDYDWAINSWGARYAGTLSSYVSRDGDNAYWVAYYAGGFYTWPAVRYVTSEWHTWTGTTVSWKLTGNLWAGAFAPGYHAYKVFIYNLNTNSWDTVQDWVWMNCAVASGSKPITTDFSKYIEWWDPQYRVFVSVCVNSPLGLTQCPYTWVDQLSVTLSY